MSGSSGATGRRLKRIARDLSRDVSRLSFGEPVTHVYAPLEYAWKPHALHLERHGTMGAPVLLVGMNPGPFGMAQTGVPFGDVELTRDWLGLEEPVGRPENEHPKRPVDGFACRRREGSGRRLWGWARDRFGTPERFFSTFFVHNYCPLCFMEESGRNRTPDKLPASEREPLLAACDRALGRVVETLEPRWVIGIGAFAERRIRDVLAPGVDGLEPRLGRILHPSPASPAANRDWSGQVEAALHELGVPLPGPRRQDRRKRLARGNG